MRQEYQSSPAAGGAADQHSALEECGDHIITISTASITEAHADEDTEQLKQQQRDRNKTQSQSQEQQPEPQQQLPLPLPAPAALPAHSAKQKLRALCQLSQLVSFQNNIADVHHRKGRRLHGLQLPLHPLQLFGWLVLVLFGLASYCVLIPAFSSPLQGPLYGLISGLYVVHVASHLAALLTDPADKELRRVHRNDRIVPEFDRARHAHVIENGRCHLCNIRTSSPRTKHCSVCNKCVGKFDHHCKWLNHCIGSRNYVAFLMCVVSAVVATLVIVAAVIAQIVLYYVQPEWLSFYWCGNDATDLSIGSLELDQGDQGAAAVFNGTDFINLTLSLSNDTLLLLEEEEQQQLYADVENVTSLIQNLTSIMETTLQSVTPTLATPISNHSSLPTVAGIGINETIFLVLIGMLGLLAAISAGLLLHLCFFHIYISFLGLTTYEYIRNHRQAQEAKAKQLAHDHAHSQANQSSTLPKNGAMAVHFSPQQQQQLEQLEQQQRYPRNPSKQPSALERSAQLYCCASVPHPNLNNSDSNYLPAEAQPPGGAYALHCCEGSREYHRQQRASKAYYLCSMLEESPPSSLAQQLGGVAPYDASSYSTTAAMDPMEQQQLRSFHCCSSFAAGALQRRVSAATTKATLVSDVEAAAAVSLSSSGRSRGSYLQYTEQCTFCSFRIKSPLVVKRSNSSSSTASSSQPTANGGGLERSAERGTPREQQRCCMKSISKHQRWRRKWNCCSSVPDSPDVPNDLLAALAYRHQQAEAAAKINAAELPVQFIRTLNGSGGGGGGSDASPRSAAVSLKSANSATTRNSRTWPVARLRHMLRMLSRYRRPRCRHQGHPHQHNNVAAVEHYQQHHHPHHSTIKQNQIRPLQLQSHSGGYYDNSSGTTPPPPPSSNSTPSVSISELSSELEQSCALYSSSESSANELILPTSIIRDDRVTTYTLTLPPALPPPTRRKMPNPCDLEELAETLGFVSHQQQQQPQRLPALNNVYRRQRRKHFLRTRSPTLSPIHESGLSNPTSPQPCRHSSSAAGGHSNSSNCSPAVGRSSSSLLVNNLCGIAGEALRKASSNSSLQSVSSNSSST